MMLKSHLNKLLKPHTNKLHRRYKFTKPAVKTGTGKVEVPWYAPRYDLPIPAYLNNAPPTKVTTLPNNIRVATQEGLGETATIGVWVDAGSAYENDANNGTAHFLEHMAFKGTQRRSQQDIELQVENIGASLNAYTSREQTAYVARSFKKDVPQMVDILSDILQNSNFDPAHIERERSVILKEKQDVEQTMEEVIFDYLHSISFQGTPLARTILGTEENIRSISRDDLVDFVQTHYTGPRMVVAAAGAINHDEVVGLCEKAFEKIPAENKIAIDNLPPVYFTGAEVKIQDTCIPQVHGAVAVEGVGWSHPDFFVFMVVQGIFGSFDRTLSGANNLCSSLADKMAQQGVMSHYHTFNTCYNETGLFGMYFESDLFSPPDVPLEGHPSFKFKHAFYEMCREFIRMARRTLAPGELERAKNKVKASLLMHLDDSSSVCEDIGRNMLALGRRMTAAEIFARIDAITHEDIVRVAETCFYDVDPSTCLLGPVSDLPQWQYYRRWFRPVFS